MSTNTATTSSVIPAKAGIQKAVEQMLKRANQNLIGLIVSLISLGVSERYDLPFLRCESVFLSIIMIISVTFTTFAYTDEYTDRKIDKINKRSEGSAVSDEE